MTASLSWARLRRRLFQFLGGGRQDEDRDQVVARRLLQLLGALPVDVEQDVAPVGQRRLHRRARRAVEVVEDARVLQQLAVRHHGVVPGTVDEAVVDARRARPDAGRGW